MKKCVDWRLAVSRVFSCMLSVCLVLALLLIPFDSVKAEEELVSSDEDFVIEDGVLIEYKGSASTVVIPEGVTKIGGGEREGKNGLNYTDTIKCVVLPKTLKEIGRCAFYMCTGLSEIEIPEGVTTIGFGAFFCCENLENITFPKSVENISSYVTFEGTAWLKAKEEESDFVVVNNVLVGARNVKGEVTIPEGVTRIAEYAMYRSGVTKLYLPESLLEIGDWAFSDCCDLQEVHMKENVTRINALAFNNCKKIKELKIPRSVKWIQGGLFSGGAVEPRYWVYKDSYGHEYVKKLKKKAKYLKYNVLDPLSEETVSVKTDPVSSDKDFVIEDGVLVAYKGFASKVVIPDGVTAIRSGGYRDYNGLNWNIAVESVVLPDSLKEIGDFAFCRCPNLTEVVMKEGVTSIGRQVFYECESLKEISIPESVTYIDSRYTFLYTPWLKQKESESDLVIVNNILVSIDSEKEEIVVPEGIIRIAGEAVVDDYGAIKRVYLPESLLEIGDWAFSGCRDLQEVYMKDNVVKVGTYAHVSSLKDFEIPKSVKEIGDRAFDECENLLVYRNTAGHEYVKEHRYMDYRLLDAAPDDVEIGREGENIIVQVQRGDTLWGISHTYLGSGLRYEEIMKLNDLKNTTIYAGQKLKVPAK